jgi:hypothetical protein
MITQVPGWSSVVRNGGITLTPPEGAHCGAIRYEERLRPLLPVRALIAEAQARDPSFRTTAVRGPERLVTTEGEHAALVVLDGNLAGVGAPVQRCIGYVFGDDFYARVAGLSLRADQFARFEDQVRKLVRGDQHFLGVRRRRFLFTPPAGYFGVERTFLHAYYYAPGFPREHAIICVYPAIPIGMWQADDLPRHLRPIHGLAVEDITGPFARSTASLGGETWELRGTLDDRQRVVRTLVVLHDDRYAYPLSLDAPASRHAAHLARFNEVVDSVQRIPGPGTTGTPTGADKNPGELKALHHWL